MRNPWSVLLLAFFSCCLTLSCEKEPASVRASRELQQMEAAYSTGSVQAAEKALMAYLELLASQEKGGVMGHDCLFGMAMTHGRLFLLYERLGNTNASSAHYAHSIAKWTEWRRREGLPAIEFSPEVLSRIVEQYDEGMRVQWKTGQSVKPQGEPQHVPPVR